MTAGVPGGEAAILERIAGRVMRDYLGVAPGERVLIVVDTRTDPAIAPALQAAAAATGGDAIVATILPRPRSGAEPPDDPARYGHPDDEHPRERGEQVHRDGEQAVAPAAAHRLTVTVTVRTARSSASSIRNARSPMIVASPVRGMRPSRSRISPATVS